MRGKIFILLLSMMIFCTGVTTWAVPAELYNIATGKLITSVEGGWNNSALLVDGDENTYGTATKLYSHATINLGKPYSIVSAKVKCMDGNMVYVNWYDNEGKNPDGQFAFSSPQGDVSWMDIIPPTFEAQTLDLFFTEKSFAKVYEIEIYTYDKPIMPINIALRKSINIKQGSLTNGGAMLDGNEGTSAATTAKWTQPWIDLGNEYTIVSARIKHTTKDERVYYFYFDSNENAVATGNNNTYVSNDGWIDLNIGSAPIRYFAFQPDPEGCGIAEIEIYTYDKPIEPTNIVLGKEGIITVKTGSLTNGGAMLDGDEGTSAVTTAKWTQSWIDLGNEYTIVSARIKHTTKDERVYYFYFDSTLETVSTGSNDTYLSETEWVDLNIPTAPIRYFAFQPDPEGCGIAELEIYAFSYRTGDFVIIKNGEKIENISGGVDSLEISISDSRPIPEGFTLLAVLYDNKGYMTDCTAVDYPAAYGTDIVSVDISNWAIGENYKLCASLVNNLTKMHIYLYQIWSN